MQQELADLKNDVAGLKVDIARVEAETRVTKHDVGNLKEMFSGLGLRIDRLDEKLVSKLESLADRLTTLNIKQERGLGFFAGMGAVVTVVGGFLLAVAKVLFGDAG